MQSEEFVELPQLKGFSKLFRTLSWYGELTFKYIVISKEQIIQKDILRQLENFYHIVFLAIAITTLEIYHIITSK